MTEGARHSDPGCGLRSLFGLTEGCDNSALEITPYSLHLLKR
jgi:hypothetical protein